MPWLWWGEFDKRYCGKWVSEEFLINKSRQRIFLKIEFQEKSGAKVFVSFRRVHFAGEVFYAESSCGALYFFHNDMEHRAEYTLKLENANSIKCDFSIKNCFGLTEPFKKAIKFIRLSEEEEKMYRYAVEPKDKSRLEVLREYAAYGEKRVDIKFAYSFDERKNMLDIIEKYGLDALVRGMSEVEAAAALMNWQYSRYKHGDIGLSKERTPQALMRFADANGGRTNCRGLALILAQLIRAYGMKAFHVTCMPYEEPFNDCHVVVSAFCGGRWIMLDPSANLYLRNKGGEIVGAPEFRDILIEGGALAASGGSLGPWNGSLGKYRDYMAKNMIRFKRGTSEAYGRDEGEGSVVLLPEKYMAEEAGKFDENTRKRFIISREDFWNS